MINNSLWPELDDIDLDNVSIEQGGATCHTNNETIDFLEKKCVLIKAVCTYVTDCN